MQHLVPRFDRPRDGGLDAITVRCINLGQHPSTFYWTEGRDKLGEEPTMSHGPIDIDQQTRHRAHQQREPEPTSQGSRNDERAQVGTTVVAQRVLSGTASEQPGELEGHDRAAMLAT
jgi:hypothetical protein